MVERGDASVAPVWKKFPQQGMLPHHQLSAISCMRLLLRALQHLLPCPKRARQSAPRGRNGYALFSSEPLQRSLRILMVCVPLLWTSAAAATDELSAPLVELPAAMLDVLREGDIFAFELPAGGSVAPVAVEITHDQQYPNGDRVLRGVDRAQQAMMVLTLNDKAAFADVTVHNRRWVFAGVRQDDMIAGRFEQPAAVTLDASLTDYVIPGRDFSAAAAPAAELPTSANVPQRRQLTPMPYPMNYSASGAIEGTDPAVATLQSQAGLRLEQRFSEPVLRVGQPDRVQVTLSLHNDGAQPLTDLWVDVYFILEDAHLLHAPGCRQAFTWSVPRQPVLSCRLPGVLEPGATRQLRYVVDVDAKAEPMRLWSTAMTGSVRHDAHLNVVYDVVTGTEEHELSDFNRALREDVPTDELGNVVIDILALYTPDAETLYGAQTPTRINQMIGVANQIYQDSGVGITLRPVFHSKVDYPAGEQVDMYTQLEQLTFGTHSAFSQVSDIREHFGADLVVLFRSMGPTTSLCGVANLGGHHT